MPDAPGRSEHSTSPGAVDRRGFPEHLSTSASAGKRKEVGRIDRRSHPQGSERADVRVALVGAGLRVRAHHGRGPGLVSGFCYCVVHEGGSEDQR